jgi:hypothetical protein
MSIDETLETYARRLLGVGGDLPSSEVVHQSPLPMGVEDGEVVFRVGPLHVRFVRDRGQDFMDMAPASDPSTYYPFADVELALGWKTAEQIVSADAPEPLSAVVDRLRSDWPELVDAFSSRRVDDTLARLAAASQRRGVAFVERLQSLAKDARKR